MADEAYLPPVVIQVLLSDTQANAGLAELEKNVTATVAAVDAETSKLGASAGAGNIDTAFSKTAQDVKTSEGEIVASVAGATGAISSESQKAASALESTGSGFSSAANSAKKAEKDVTSATEGMAATASSDFSALGGAAVGGGRKVEGAEDDLKDHSHSFAGDFSKVFSGIGSVLANFGLPFASSASKLSTTMDKVGQDSSSFGSKLAGMKTGALIAGAALLAIGAEALHLSDTYEKSESKLDATFSAMGKSSEQFKGQIEGSQKSMEGLGFNMSETDEALAKLNTATQNPTKSFGLLGLSADLARYRNIGLSEAGEQLGKVMAGNNRALIQLGVNLNVGTTKLQAMQKAEESVTAAKKSLQAAEQNLTAAKKKAAEEQKAALEKVQQAEEGVKQAQNAIISDNESLRQSQNTVTSDTEGLAAAQEALGKTQREAAEVGKKAAEEQRQAAEKVRSAEESVRTAQDTVKTGQESLVSAQNTLKSDTEGLIDVQDKLKEAEQAAAAVAVKAANEVKEAQRSVQEAEEGAAETAGNSASEVASAKLDLKKTELEVGESKEDAAKKAITLEEAQKKVTDAERKASDDQKKSLNSLQTAREKLTSAQKNADVASAEQVAASHRIVEAQQAVSQQERKIVEDHEKVGAATRAVSMDEEKLVDAEKAVNVARSVSVNIQQKEAEAANKVKEAVRSVSQAERKLVEDHEKVGASERQLVEGHANLTKAQRGVAKAQEEARRPAENIRTAMIAQEKASESLQRAETQLRLDETSKGKIIAALEQRLKGQAEMYSKTLPGAMAKARAALENLGIALGMKLTPIVLKVTQVIAKSVHGWVLIFTELLPDIVNLVKSHFGSIVKFMLLWPFELGIKLGKLFFNLGEKIIEALIEGISNLGGKVGSTLLKYLNPAHDISSLAHIVGLAEGGVVTKPTLAVVGEAGPEAVVPLKNVSATNQSIQPLSTNRVTGSAATGNGITIENMVLQGSSQSDAQNFVNQLYLKFRPLIQTAGSA